MYFEEHAQEAAYAIARIVLGVLFLFQGYDKLFGMRFNDVVKTIAPKYKEQRVPEGFIWISVALSSLIEFAGGLLLILGLFTLPVIYIMGLNLLLVSLAFSFANPMWDMQYYFPRLVLLLFLLIIPTEWNTLSLDHLIGW